MTMAAELDPALWERRPDETPQAYAALASYRDMGAERSCAKVGRELGKSRALIERWSARHDWVERIKAYDAHEERQWLGMLSARRRQTEQLQAEAVVTGMTKVVAGLRGIECEDLSVSELARLGDMVTRISARLYPNVEDHNDWMPVIVFHSALRYPSQQLEADVEGA